MDVEPGFGELLRLAMEAAEEVSRHDEGDYRARHALMDFVAGNPSLIVRLINNEEDRMALLVNSPPERRTHDSDPHTGDENAQ
jgi:hypothetical protein